MAATAEMLAAQAQGGSAGVQAYLAAQQEIAARQQATVAQMQADAISRGSPVAGAVGGMVTAGSDALLNQLAVMQANAGAEDSARSARMSDYSRQAAMAGGLIPLQAQADASLVRARGESDLARINAQGRNSLEEQRLSFSNQQAAREQERRDQVEYIKWQMRQDAAEKAAREAEEREKENTLTVEEAEAMATLAARDKIAPAARKAQSTLDAPGYQRKNAGTVGQGVPSRSPSLFRNVGNLVEGAMANVVGERPRGVGQGVPLRGTTGPVAPMRVVDPKKAKEASLKAKERQAKERAGQVVATYNDPVAMRDQVATQAAGLQDQGYVVTPEVMSRLLNQPFLSAGQMDARDRGLPYTEEQQYAAAKRQESMAADQPDGLDPVREMTAGAFGLDFDALVAKVDVDPGVAAAYVAGESRDIAADLTEVDAFLAENPEATRSEVDAYLRTLGLNPAQVRILRELKGL